MGSQELNRETKDFGSDAQQKQPTCYLRLGYHLLFIAFPYCMIMFYIHMVAITMSCKKRSASTICIFGFFKILKSGLSSCICR